MDDTTLRELLLTPPDEFVAARNALASSLKRSGASDDAAEVGALRRPGWTDWALNTAADTAPDDVAAFAGAADAMRAAQRDALTGHGEGVAAALREVRARTTELARRADAVLTGRGRAGELGALVERLTAVAGSGVATARLRQAILRAGDEQLDEPDQPDDEPVVSAPRPARPPRAANRTANRSAPGTAEPVEPAGTVAGAAALAAERRALMRSVAEHERAVRTAEHHAARAEQALAEATTKRELAEAAVARAQAELERVAARADDAAATARELRAAADAEAQALADLRTRLDALGA